MSVTLDLADFKDLERQLEKLSKAAGKGALRRSLEKSAAPMVDLAKSWVPVDDGDLRDSITVGVKLAKRQAGQHRKMFQDDRASVEMFLGPSYNLGAGGRHGHLVEFGTKPHINGGKYAGTQNPGTAPQPFMRPAFDQDVRKMLDRLGEDLWVEIEKSVLRAERKAARVGGKV